MKNPDDEIMQRRRTTPVERLSLKMATEHTVQACGGGASAVYSTRIGETQICRCADRRDADYLAIDVAADLQVAAGFPFIAEAMCRIMGFAVVKVDALPATQPCAEEGAHLLGAATDFIVQYLKATADRHLDDKECRELQPLLEKLKERVRIHDAQVYGASPKLAAAE